MGSKSGSLVRWQAGFRAELSKAILSRILHLVYEGDLFDLVICCVLTLWVVWNEVGGLRLIVHKRPSIIVKT